MLDQKPLWKVLEEITPPDCCELHQAYAEALDKEINPTREHGGAAPLPYLHCPPKVADFFDAAPGDGGAAKLEALRQEIRTWKPADSLGIRRRP